jgi:LmbE family N-acetylglucosaminyl deacetylase
MSPKPVDILLIAAHPDDTEFGAGGSIARWIKEGKKIAYVICTNGNKGSSDPNMNPEVLAKTREQEELAAARLLGVSDVIFLGHPDQSLEDTPEFRKEIVREIRRFKPATVGTSDLYRRYIWHRDHRIIGRVVMDAVFPFARDFHAYPDLAAEGFEPHKVTEVLLWGAEDINHRIDITDYFETKLAAVACHKSQVGGEISPEMRERLRGRAVAEAEGADFQLGEAFHRVEILR